MQKLLVIKLRALIHKIIKTYNTLRYSILENFLKTINKSI